ncbi:hypothetical protein [Clostridium saccharobutylicum]|uniref:Uncharacterized protein n=1 Tax=Clostridium saccharobutylicum DSM 13864 TaxID=1345695 RepID=U5MYN8_CLOSA|nr:hypothetical protein [Clostridium saccharobutylicum]AGX44607.1 hypothetical protein CLSA_c36460 [Clostridium saccharobutylicum DSM 13864]AQR91898.1 hypothetical protein CLOSC_36260 [Clostridium saccharobutylicum]AQS01800.1 hypothetical protein CSACC_36310 [Clostridium saccharobutylicum]AQS15783.1 hypothetical protein CLOSACC_36310 [Clostridium saccharobutylicum]MBA2906528.1 hypothetical protein [Clostridium saccharobutylicum]
MKKQIKEFIKNDIYFMEVLSDKIIINDNYNGILVFDKNLELIKKLEIFEDITIYYSFVNNIGGEILLFCPNNECIVYINIETYEYEVIYLKNGLENLIFSNLYEWNDNGLILSTYNGEFYSVCIDEKLIQKIDYKEVERLYPKLNRFYRESTNQKIIKVLPDEYTAIVEAEKNNINAINYEKETKQTLNNVSFNFIDIEFREGIFILFDENRIEVIEVHGKEVLNLEDDYIFLKAKFVNKMDGIYLLILSSSNSNSDCSRIDIIQISTL